MMFTCAMMKRMLLRIGEIKPISYTTLRKVYDDLVVRITDSLEAAACKPKESVEGLSQQELSDRTDLIKAIVYNQVYTASHGDEELARAMSKMYAETPVELWDKMIYERLNYESDKRFTVHYTEGQYSLPCEVMMNGMLNKEFCTWYDHKNCYFVVMNNPLMMDTDAYNCLIEVIDKEITEDHPMVILCHSNIDTGTYQDLVARLNELVTKNKPVAIFHVNTTMGDWNPDVNDFRTLQLLCGQDLTKMRRTQNRNELTVAEHAHVTWRNKTLTLDDLYEVPEEYKNDPRRHQAIDGKHMHYTDYLAAVKKYAEGYAKLPVTKINREMTTLMYRTYAKLMYKRLACIQIGGSVHDNVALIDIVDDCVRASARALREGITFGNNKALYNILKDIRNKTAKESSAWCDTDEFGRRSKVSLWLIDLMIESLEDMATAQMELLFYGHKLSKRDKEDFIKYWFTRSVDVINFVPEDYDSYGFRFVDPEGEDVVSQIHSSAVVLTNASGSTINGVITQPISTDISMLKRFGEVALKFALSGRIIVSNAAYVGDEKKRGNK
jgi:hypothetical protein